MTDNIVNLFGVQLHDDTPEVFFDKMKKNADEFQGSVVVIGQDENGKLIFGGNNGDLKDALWLVMAALRFIQDCERTITEA